ncbi:MAG: hypothetical protein ACLPN5_05830, partial [Roseiarcus sp.]
MALVALAALIVYIFYRSVFGHRLRVPGGRTRQPRLGVVDAFSVDGQRQLVLVRRDNVEHLIMIGGPNDVVVESAIVRMAAPSQLAPPPASPMAASAPPPPPVAASVEPPPPAPVLAVRTPLAARAPRPAVSPAPPPVVAPPAVEPPPARRPAPAAA